MLTLLMAVVLAQAPDATNVHPYAIETRYDRVKDFTVCKLVFESVIQAQPNDVDVDVSFYCTWPGAGRDALKASSRVIILFTSASTSWEFMKAHDVAILADAHRVKPEVEHDGNVETGFVTETMSCPTTLEHVRKMAATDTIEFAVGLHKFELTDLQVTALRDFAARLSVSSEEADKLDGAHRIAKRKRDAELKAAMDKAVGVARYTVKRLPRDQRGTPKANQVGIEAMAREFAPTYRRYHVAKQEYAELLQAYPEFAAP